MSTSKGYGACAPTTVHSCLIKNNSDAEVNVQVEFTGLEDHHHEIADIELAQGEEQVIDEKEFQDGSAKFHKVVDLVRVKKYDGTIIELKQPFDGVTSPVKNWIFEINNDSIKSVDPENK